MTKFLKTSAPDMTGSIARYRDGSLSPVTAAETALERIEACEPHLNAFVLRADPAGVMAQAEDSAKRWARREPCGPLDGVLVAVKDNFRVQGWPTRSGSLTTSAAPSDHDAPAVARLKEAGAILIGKTTMPEFGWTGVTQSRLSGLTRNPYDPSLTPGGSSGGSAAAVAAGFADAALGTDAAGSIRIPAAFCGLVGLKPSRGRVPAFPASALWTLGHAGIIATSVRDCALLLDVLSQPDVRDWNPLPPAPESFVSALGRADLSSLRIAYCPRFGGTGVDAAIADCVAAAVDRLRRRGIAVEEISQPYPDAAAAFRAYFETGISHAVRRLTPENRAKLDPGFARAVERGQQVSREAFLEAYEFQIGLCREARAFHARYDLLLTPTVAVLPFAAGRISPEGYDPENWLEWTPFTYPFNLTGQPALTLPCGQAQGGLPVGLQLVGPMFGDALVLRAAAEVESIVGSPKQA